MARNKLVTDGGSELTPLDDDDKINRGPPGCAGGPPLLGDQRGKSVDFGVNQPLMARAFASSDDRLGQFIDLKRLLQLGRGAKGSGNIG
jgi:hypothetical protein